MPKLGIIRCEAYAEKCAGYKCFPALAAKTGSFSTYADGVELVGFDTCGGCARNDTGKIVERANRLKEKGAEAIHLGNCLVNACPWVDSFREAIAKATQLPVMSRTHP